MLSAIFNVKYYSHYFHAHLHMNDHVMEFIITLIFRHDPRRDRWSQVTADKHFLKKKIIWIINSNETASDYLIKIIPSAL